MIKIRLLKLTEHLNTIHTRIHYVHREFHEESTFHTSSLHILLDEFMNLV